MENGRLLRSLGMTDVSRIFALLAAFAIATGAGAQDRAAGTHSYRQVGSGAPVVVFEAGLGGTLDTWRTVQKDVSAFTETFSYNRAGHAGSPRAVGTGDAATIVAELRALLTARGLAPPYALVSHSAGGLYFPYYARNFPDEVAGVVLVNSSHWDQWERFRRVAPVAADPRSLRDVRSHIRREDEAFETSGREVLDSPSLRPMPLTVISAGLFTGSPNEPAAVAEQRARLWGQMQSELAAQMPNARHVIAERSDHFVQDAQPQLVVAGIRDMIEKVRSAPVETLSR